MKPANQNVIDFIDHYGKKGMHWGVRTQRGKSSQRVRRGTNRTAYSKHPANLSTHELQQRIQRMETEKRYNQLNSRDVSHGEKLATQILTQVGTGVASTVLMGAGLLAVRAAVKSKFGEDTAKFITGKRK